ncbi:MAG: hypothetical protein ACXAD7_03505 [Candidatus Kariarchaeaceae archaeon]|jgi:hypothetical protein
MVLDNFSNYLKEKKLDEDNIKAALKLTDEFIKFFSVLNISSEKVNYDEFYKFALYMIKQKLNTYDNFVHLLRFAHFKKNDEMIIAIMETVDGAEMMANFSQRLINEFSQEVRDELFGEFDVPPLGIHPKKRPEITIKLVERFIDKFGKEKSIEFFAKGLRDKYTEWYKQARKTFLETNNIDAFLKTKRENFIKNLENHKKEKTLFFTQEINQEVMDYVLNEPSIEGGVREGNILTVSKIPYLTKQFLNATEEKKRRYYFCHNPWIREALNEDEQPVSPIFCNCSGGYYKDYWGGVLDTEIRVDLLESVIMGDKTCKFAIHLPQDIVDLVDQK